MVPSVVAICTPFWWRVYVVTPTLSVAASQIRVMEEVVCSGLLSPPGTEGACASVWAATGWVLADSSLLGADSLPAASNAITLKANPVLGVRLLTVKRVVVPLVVVMSVPSR